MIQLSYGSFYMVHRKPSTEDIILCDEDNPYLGEVLVFCPLGDFSGVDETDIEASSLGIGAFISTLYLYIVDFAIAIHGEDIEADAAAVEIVGRVLCDNFLHDYVCAVEEDTQQELHAFDATIEAHVEEGIIDKAELLDGLKVFGIEAG
jgi:hypothetical protein